MALLKENAQVRSVGYGTVGLPTSWDAFTLTDTLPTVLADGYFNILLPSIFVDSIIFMKVQGTLIEFRVSEITDVVDRVVKVVEYHGVAAAERDFTKALIDWDAPQPANFIAFTFKVEVTGMQAVVISAIEATDDALITFEKAFGSVFLPAPPHLTIPGGTAVGGTVATASLTSFFTGDNILLAGESLQINPLKTTPGGQAELQIFYRRIH